MIDLIDFVIESLRNIPDVSVRGAYDTAKPVYPMITVMQMDNYELPQYTTIDTIERASAIPFQIDCYARNMVIEGNEISAENATRHFRILADEIMQNTCGMRRTSGSATMPHTTDKLVMRAISRYDCMIDLVRQIIYKK